MDEYCDKSLTQSGEPEKNNSLLAFKGISTSRETFAQPVDGTYSNTACQNYTAYGSEYSAGDDQASSSLKDHSDKFYSLMEEDKSILICLPAEAQKAPASVVHSGLVTTISEEPAGSSETLKADECPMKISTAEKYTSPMPRAPTCDAMVGTDLTEGVLAFTQTEDPATADKDIITEVHMADLDYLAEVRLTLKN